MGLRKIFSYKHHCDKYGNGHYDSNNSYQTFSTASCETIDSCPHMSAFGFLSAVPQDFQVLNEHDPQRLSASLSTPHPFLCHECRIYFVFIVNFSDLLKVLQS